jgi:hypothetical protein
MTGELIERMTPDRNWKNPCPVFSSWNESSVKELHEKTLKILYLPGVIGPDG